MKIIVIGAPSMQETVEQSIAEQLDGVEFPLDALVENRMPRDIALPEMKGLFLRHVCNNEGLSSQVVRIDDLSQIQRTAASIEQIAEMNKYQTAIIITIGDLAETNPDSNAGSGGGEGGGEGGNTNDPTSEPTDDSTNGGSGNGEANANADANADASETSKTGTADANANTSTGADTKTNANVPPKEVKGKTKATKSTKSEG